ncbi:MAG: hypothetical protein EG824_11495, partial [Deltaproteobacteria bacterium]|nr:hypothetical protein [Deltaproteobacteria bacterium]
MLRSILLLVVASSALAFEGPFSFDAINSDYGPRNPGNTGSRFHMGLDYSRSAGTPVEALANGIIDSVYYQINGGGYILSYRASNRRWSYMHMMQRCNNGVLNTEFKQLNLVDTASQSITPNKWVLIFWKDKNKYIAHRVLSSVNGRQVQYDRFHKVKSAADTTRNILTTSQVVAGETIGPVGSTGASSGPHLHLGLAGGGQNPLCALDYTQTDPVVREDSIRPRDNGTVFRAKRYSIRFQLDNSPNKDLDSVSIQYDNDPPRVFCYGGKTTAHEHGNYPSWVNFYDTTGVWPQGGNGLVGMSNDRFILCRDLTNDTLGPHTVRFFASTISGRTVNRTVNFTLADGFAVSSTDPVDNRPDVDINKEVRIRLTRPVAPSTVTQTSVTFTPELEHGFNIAFEDDARTIVLRANDPAADFAYDTRYTLCLKGDQIIDTSQTRLDGDGDGAPGGDFPLRFTTRKPKLEYSLSPVSIKFAGGGSANIAATLDNKDPRQLNVTIRASATGSACWSHRLSRDSITMSPNEKVVIGNLLTISLSQGGSGGYCVYTSIDLASDNKVYKKHDKQKVVATKVDTSGGGGGGGYWAGGDGGIVISGGDDNWSLADPNYPSPWLFDDEAGVG